MSFFEVLALAYRSVRTNIVRTIITCCIIGFGIMALVGILTVVDGLKSYLSKSFSSMGAGTFKIRNKSLGFNLDADNSEPQKIFRSISFLESTQFKEKFNDRYSTSIQYLANQGSTAKFGNKKTNPNILVIGSDENYLVNESYTLLQGRNFTTPELKLGSNVIMIGYTVAKKLFGANYNLDNMIIRLDDVKYKVIGVLDEKGSSFITTDNMVLVPLAKARQLYAQENPSYIISVKGDDPENMEPVQEEATLVMRNVRKLHPGEQINFDLLKSDSISGMFVEKMKYATMAGFIIGIITLIGAAIGLMNIMLVSVTERTKEIGTLKAIGANNQSIRLQFLLEAMVICQFGGFLGIVLGIAAGNAVSLSIGGAFIIPWMWMLVGIAFCLIVGLVSGIYPAYKASLQDPIEALRYE
ncbi:MAG: ABC-type antimicrobial peptide transport system, permease component [Bacteroidota bacterium]|nr:ABC-type antimicrobial peptide transport system, permease component [Bacteroidota bacterium]